MHAKFYFRMKVKYLRIILGLYDNICKVKVTKFILKLYCAVYCTVLSIIVFNNSLKLRPPQCLHDIVLTMQFIVEISVYMFIEDEYFIDFIAKLRNANDKQEFVSSTTAFVCFFISVLAIVFSFALLATSLIYGFIAVFQHSAIAIILIYMTHCAAYYRVILSFHLLLNCLKYTKKRLCHDLRVSNLNLEGKYNCVFKFTREILDLLQNSNKNIYHNCYVINLLIACGIINTIFKVILFAVHCLDTEAVFSEYWGSCLWFCQIMLFFILICTPILIGELVNYEFDEMMNILSDELLKHEGVTSLRDVMLLVQPETVIRGGTAALICARDMQGAPLYSVKWYRGNHEFYRYTPNEEPDTRVFGLPGIFVDMNRSNGTQVLLRRLDLSLAGNFSCEVTADSPSFATQIANKLIDVVALPAAEPVLLADKDRYQPGDLLLANCTSSPSRPAANLTIMINDQPLRSSEMSLHPAETGLTWSTVKSEVKITPELFLGGRMRVACHTSLYDVYNASANLDFFTPETDPRPERITLTGGASTCFLSWILLLFLFLLPMLVVGEEYFLDYEDLPYYDEEKYNSALKSLV